MATTPPLRIAMVGHAFMGRAHSHAWRTVGHVFPLPRQPEMRLLCGRDQARAAAAADALGWVGSTADLDEVLTRDDIDLVDICSPGDTHAAVAIAALDAGKHVLCEKPLARTLHEAESMRAAAERAAGAGVASMVGFNYRRLPAIGLAQRLIDDGRVGEVRQVRAVYLQDWLADAEAPFTWRMDRAAAGSGALGDIASHIVDLVQHLTGQSISTVSGLLHTFVHERPSADGPRPVTVDDATLFMARLDGGGLASFEATRMATGRRNNLRVEVNGTRGSLAFDLQRMNELEVHDATTARDAQGFTTILATEPDHPWLEGWWPPGHVLGWDHSFVHQARDLVVAIADGRRPSPGFADGLQVQAVLDAVERSATSGAWESPRW